MFFKKKSKKQEAKRLPEGTYRVIKIGKKALWEFIYESVIEHEVTFFDLPERNGLIPDEDSVTSHHDIDFETGEYICLINHSNSFRLDERIDLKKLLKNMAPTTHTLFSQNRYVDLTIDDIKKIQGSE